MILKITKLKEAAGMSVAGEQQLLSVTKTYIFTGKLGQVLILLFLCAKLSEEGVDEGVLDITHDAH